MFAFGDVVGELAVDDILLSFYMKEKPGRKGLDFWLVVLEMRVQGAR